MKRLVVGFLFALVPYCLFAQTLTDVVEQKEAEIEISEKYIEALVEKLEHKEAELKTIELKNNQTLVVLNNQKAITYVLAIALLITVSLLFIVLRNSRKLKEEQ